MKAKSLINAIANYLRTTYLIDFEYTACIVPNLSCAARTIKESESFFTLEFSEEPITHWVIHEMAHVAAWCIHKQDNLGHRNEFMEIYDELMSKFYDY